MAKHRKPKKYEKRTEKLLGLAKDKGNQRASLNT
jgi:hypothetical protein